ncbi:hypothetical protein KY284_010672 [Solanum tuberosum]|nr:hypothetical protein KY284_010672 [Solanum tuberosum]
MEEVKLKHREYCWKFGMTVFQEDEDKSNKVGTLGTGENNGNAVINFKQKLYKACSFAIKSYCARCSGAEVKVVIWVAQSQT